MPTLGEYQILQEIGRGAFSVVYKAQKPPLERFVAIKMIHPQLLVQNPKALQALYGEAALLAKLHNPNIIRILDIFTQEDRLYLVLEYLAGGDLAHYLKQHPNLTLQQQIALLQPIAEALDYLHNQNIVHGDIKPANILFGSDERPRLSDFGVIAALTAVNTSLRQRTGEIYGTPRYISPEQARGQAPQTASDQYALAAVAYELLCSQPPFTGENEVALYASHIQAEPPPPSSLNPAIGDELDAALLKALSKDPAQRYPSCGEFVRALKHAHETGNARQMQHAIQQTEQALQAGDGEQALQALQHAQALGQDPRLAALQQRVDRLYRASRAYREAAQAYGRAHTAAQALRPQHPPDPQKLLDRLDPPPPPRWRSLLNAWQPAITGALLLIAVAFVGALAWVLYTETAGAHSSLPTLVAVVRTPTPTATFTPTFTPTPTPTRTFTPTPTPTFTPAAGDSLTTQIGALNLTWRYVPAGEFEMGSDNGGSNERPVHTVYTAGFWMLDAEVTNAQLAAFLNANGNQGENGAPWLDETDSDVRIHRDSTGTWRADSGYEDHPAVEVSWYGAQAFCKAAGGDLPSEAQWEKAARGGLIGKTYPWGDQNPICTPGAANGAQSNNCNGQTVSVKSFAPNGYGLYDMSGNVWEWLRDWYDSAYYSTSPRENPQGPNSGEYRGVRGGAWASIGGYLRVADRYWHRPDLTYNYLGFRCLRSP